MSSCGSAWANASDMWENMTLREYLEEERGAKHLPLQVVLPVSAVYAAIFVTGLVGNTAVCAVIVRMPELHTVTNYYLFSLAISDLALVLLGLPYEVSMFWEQYPWPLGEPLCKFRAVVSEMVSYTSVLTIVAFSTERYVAICHPLYALSMSLHRTLLVIGSIWLVALFAAVPFGAFTKVSYIDFPPDSGRCVEESAFCAMLHVPERYPVYELSMLFFFLLPMVALVVLYTRMAAKLWWTAKRGHQLCGAVHRRSGSSSSRRAVVKMLAAVVAAFFLCWAPFHLQRLLYLYAREMEFYNDTHEVMFFVTGCLYYFSSTVNTILYSVMSARYRQAFRHMLCCRAPPPASGRRLGREASSFQESAAYGSVYVPCRRQTMSSGLQTPVEPGTPRLAVGPRLTNGVRVGGAAGDASADATNGKRYHHQYHRIADSVKAVAPDVADDAELVGLCPAADASAREDNDRLSNCVGEKIERGETVI